jgi:hypothetical protein
MYEEPQPSMGRSPLAGGTVTYPKPQDRNFSHWASPHLNSFRGLDLLGNQKNPGFELRPHVISLLAGGGEIRRALAWARMRKRGQLTYPLGLGENTMTHQSKKPSPKYVSFLAH